MGCPAFADPRQYEGREVLRLLLLLVAVSDTAENPPNKSLIKIGKEKRGQFHNTDPTILMAKKKVPDLVQGNMFAVVPGRTSYRENTI